MKVCFVAAPLMARSGVYRSALDLVSTARAAGHDWSAVVGVRPQAAGERAIADGIVERKVTSHGRSLFAEIRGLLADSAEVQSADVIISMIPQSDMTISRMASLASKRRIAWVRGLPWPGKGEQAALRSLALTTIEHRALTSMHEVWATSPLLARQIGAKHSPVIVAAGVPGATRLSHGDNGHGPLVWAGRLSPEKGPKEFLRLLVDTGLPGRLHGTGPLEAELRASAPANLAWAGWSRPDEVLRDASIFVATSHRDAFGRGPVEAALVGIPVILSDQVGAAPMLYTDADLRGQFVIPPSDGEAWASAASALLDDVALRRRVSDHISGNASRLTIDSSVAAVMSQLEVSRHAHLL